MAALDPWRYFIISVNMFGDRRGLVTRATEPEFGCDP